MTYDTDNRLTTVVKSGTTVNYTYDFAHRIAKRSVGVLATRYIYDQNWNVLAEINSTGATTRLYLHGPSVDEVLAQVSGGGATVDYLLKDHLGSTTALYRPGSGVQQRFTYDEYGAVQVRDAAGNPSAAAPATRYLFTGREFDVTTGLYHYRHRWYHPETGRFVSPDPIGFEGGDMNVYCYAMNRPPVASDPSGLTMEDLKKELDAEKKSTRQKQKAKEGKKKCDIPVDYEGHRPLDTETPDEFAKRLVNARWKGDNEQKKAARGPTSDHSKLKKYCETYYYIPKE